LRDVAGRPVRPASFQGVAIGETCLAVRLIRRWSICPASSRRACSAQWSLCCSSICIDSIGTIRVLFSTGSYRCWCCVRASSSMPSRRKILSLPLSSATSVVVPAISVEVCASQDVELFLPGSAGRLKYFQSCPVHLVEAVWRSGFNLVERGVFSGAFFSSQW